MLSWDAKYVSDEPNSLMSLFARRNVPRAVLVLAHNAKTISQLLTLNDTEIYQVNTNYFSDINTDSSSTKSKEADAGLPSSTRNKLALALYQSRYPSREPTIRELTSWVSGNLKSVDG